MSTVGAVCAALEAFAPTASAEEWDNVGLLLGTEEWPVERAVIAVDLTMSVVEEAIAERAGMIIAYHPPIFRPITRLTDAYPRSHAVLVAARAAIALHSPHTALDACAGGLNDWLADGVGEGDRRAIRPAHIQPSEQACKFVVFCPVEAVERVRNGLTMAGAGNIGNYEQCSFEIEGVGTFRGNEASHPSIGEAGRLERIGEVRLEMVCSEASLPRAVEVVRELHPYEEPPIEIYRLLARPVRSSGSGRRVTLDRPVSVTELAARVRAHLALPAGALEIAAPRGMDASIRTIGLCAGSGGALIDDAHSMGCDVFLTGEMGHHEMLAAYERGCTVMLAGHTRTERGYMPLLRDRLAASVGNVTFTVATTDSEIAVPR